MGAGRGNAVAGARGGDEGASVPGSPAPSSTPHSPLTFGPQAPMAPTEFSLGPSGSTAHGYNPDLHGGGWVAAPALVPTPIVWSHGGNHVEVEGSFDNWTSRTEMHRTGKDFTVIKMIPPGVYQYKFIVDGAWKYAPEQPAMYDERGNVNNVVEVCEYTPENLDNLHSFAPPGSPPSSYACPAPSAEDFAKEPPSAPPQLGLTLLNVEACGAGEVGGGGGGLPRPSHVVLNHLYVERRQGLSKGVAAVGVTHRFRSKYVSLVLFSPAKPPQPQQQQQQQAAAQGGGGDAMQS